MVEGVWVSGLSLGGGGVVGYAVMEFKIDGLGVEVRKALHYWPLNYTLGIMLGRGPERERWLLIYFPF